MPPAELTAEVVARPLAALPVDDAALDAAERARAATFVHGRDRDRFVAGRALLRAELAVRTGRSPAEVELVVAPCPRCGGPHGRPGSPGAGFELSLSRADDLVVVAFAPVPIGVDVEALARPVTVEELDVARHPAEPRAADRAGALRRWVRKEAYLKGLGTGLGVDPASVDLRADPEGWTLLDVDAGPEHLVSLAVRTAAPVRVVLT